VVCGEDGVAIFDALHRHGTVREAILQAFDLVELNGEDFRPQPLGKRKARLARLLARAPAQRAHGRGRRQGVPARLRDGVGGDRVEAPGSALSIRPVEGLDQSQEPGQPGDDPGARALRAIEAMIGRGGSPFSSHWEGHIVGTEER
jgi:hypothetical protein